MPISRNIRRCVAALLGSILVFVATRAAFAAEDDGGKYSDEKYGFVLTVSSTWKSAPLQAYSVPGVARAAWKGAGNASIVAFVQEPGKAFSPRFLVDASAASMKTALGAKVVAQEVKAVAGKQAMWLVVEGKGTGGAIDGKGDVATTQHWVAIPREKDILVVLLTCPAADYPAAEKAFVTAVDAMTVKGDQTAEQKDAK